MNRQEAEILKSLHVEPFINQRILSESTGLSLGVVNRSIRQLIIDGYLNGKMQLTHKAKAEVVDNSPKNAIILSAGFGMRMVTINYTTPKALLEVRGEKLIERLIKQLRSVGVMDIHLY